MCGIVGYAGYGDAKTYLMRALNDLEYRGYDSAGVAVFTNDGIEVIKRAGPVSALEEKINGQLNQATAGIAHTRWATHGSPTDSNAHPHLSYDGKVAIAHNGIIENHLELRNQLHAEGIDFRSETDSESIAHLIAQSMYNGLSLLDATKQVSTALQGLSVILAISADEPDAIVGLRVGYAGSLIAGKSRDANVLASNTAAMPSDVAEATYIDHCEAVYMDRDNVEIVNVDGVRLFKAAVPLLPENRITEIGGHAHFMHKEISEQAATMQGAMKGRVDFNRSSINVQEIRNLQEHLERIVLVGMGTSHFAALSGARWLERLAGIPTHVEYAGEIADRDPVMTENDLLIAVSQSGETYDTLAAIETARRKGSKVAVVTSAMHSEAARTSDFAIDIGSGVEVAVPSTKTFINSMLVLYMISLQLGQERHRLSHPEIQRHIAGLAALPRAINRTIGQESEVANLVNDRLRDITNMLILGRGDLLPIALEGALKMKETAYVHAEGCSASEMKHGINALIEPSVPTVVLVPRDAALRSKMMTNIHEVKSRNGTVIALAAENDLETANLADAWLPISLDYDEHAPFLMTIPLQQMAYHTAISRSINPDRPRNLAKTVTVA